MKIDRQAGRWEILQDGIAILHGRNGDVVGVATTKGDCYLDDTISKVHEHVGHSLEWSVWKSRHDIDSAEQVPSSIRDRLAETSLYIPEECTDPEEYADDKIAYAWCTPRDEEEYAADDVDF